MRTRSALGFVLALAWLAGPYAARGDSPREQAVRLANQGNVDQAIKVLRDALEMDPRSVQTRGLLGGILDFDGRPDEAVAVWREGLDDQASDFPLLMAIGKIRLRQGNDGPTIQYRRGTVTAMPSKDKAVEEQFKKARLAEAATAYEKARSVKPDSAEAARALASVYEAQARFDAAVEAWRSLLTLDPRKAEYHLGLGLATEKAGRKDDAPRYFQQAIALNPRMAEAHEALAASQERAGQTAEAALSRKRAGFYSRLPEFATLDYSEENLKTLDSLDQKAAVRKLIADPSERATEFLAILCWSHPHDSLESEAFDALEARGDRTTELLRSLLGAAQSTCTIRSAAHILARRKADGIFDYFVKMLPGDLRAPGMNMDIAGSLDDLGDPRAVALLAQVLNPGGAPGPEQGLLIDRAGARARAALALGAFDTPESRRTLEAVLGDRALAPYARAALYRLTRDPAQLDALEKAIPPDQAYLTYLLGDYLLHKVDTEPARKLAQRWERLRAAEEAREKSEKNP